LLAAADVLKSRSPILRRCPADYCVRRVRMFRWVFATRHPSKTATCGDVFAAPPSFPIHCFTGLSKVQWPHYKSPTVPDYPQQACSYQTGNRDGVAAGGSDPGRLFGKTTHPVNCANASILLNRSRARDTCGSIFYLAPPPVFFKRRVTFKKT
jgi:hypothetical protein